MYICLIEKHSDYNETLLFKKKKNVKSEKKNQRNKSIKKYNIPSTR